MKSYSQTNTIDAPELLRTRPELAAPKLERGYWLNEWFSAREWNSAPNGLTYPAGPVFADKRYPSRELAEEFAAKWYRERCLEGNPFGVQYLGPVFFPDDGSAS